MNQNNEQLTIEQLRTVQLKAVAENKDKYVYMGFGCHGRGSIELVPDDVEPTLDTFVPEVPGLWIGQCDDALCALKDFEDPEYCKLVAKWMMTEASGFNMFGATVTPGPTVLDTLRQGF